jgi:hypothetical protein
MSGDYLTKLRQKPKHVRDNIAFGVASGVTAIVALFLVFAVHGPTVVEEVANEDNSPRFFQTLVNQAKEQVAASRSSMNSVQEENTPLEATTPAANGNGAPAPAVLSGSSSVVVVSSTTRTVLIATTSAATDVSR